MNINTLVGSYLKGFEKGYTDGDDDLHVYLFIRQGGDINKIVDVYSWGDGYRNGEWDFREITEKERTDAYKAIGEDIISVEQRIMNQQCADADSILYLIKTQTKILYFQTDFFDSYYPHSLWDIDDVSEA